MRADISNKEKDMLYGIIGKFHESLEEESVQLCGWVISKDEILQLKRRFL